MKILIKKKNYKMSKVPLSPDFFLCGHTDYYMQNTFILIAENVSFFFIYIFIIRDRYWVLYCLKIEVVGNTYCLSQT